MHLEMVSRHIAVSAHVTGVFGTRAVVNTIVYTEGHAVWKRAITEVAVDSLVTFQGFIFDFIVRPKTNWVISELADEFLFFDAGCPHMVAVVLF